MYNKRIEAVLLVLCVPWIASLALLVSVAIGNALRVSVLVSTQTLIYWTAGQMISAVALFAGLLKFSSVQHG